MDLVALAHDTLAAILARGEDVAPSGATVELDLDRCVQESRTWGPEELADLVERRTPASGPPTKVEVTDETTGAAARRRRRRARSRRSTSRPP